MKNKVLDVSHKFLNQIINFSVHGEHFSGHYLGRLPLVGWFLSGFFSVHQEVVIKIELKKFGDFLDFVIDEGEDDEYFFVH